MPLDKLRTDLSKDLIGASLTLLVVTGSGEINEPALAVFKSFLVKLSHPLIDLC